MDNEYVLTSDGQLYHWGIKGMKWGVRRYQNKDGSLTKAGQKRYDDKLDAIKAKTEKVRAKQEAKRAVQEKKDAVKAAKQELKDAKNGPLNKLKSFKKNNDEKKAEKEVEKSIEDDNAKRERILSKPTAKEILANRHLFNDREIQCLRLRLQEEKMIESMMPADIDRGQQFVDKFTNKAAQVSSVIESGSKAWNSIAKLYNSTFGSKNGLQLPMISDKVRSKADKIKEEADLLEAKNRLIKAQKEAQKEDPDRPKTEAEKYAEETKQINSEVARRTAENKLREAERNRAKMDAEDAEAKATADENARKAKATADENARKANEERSWQEYEKATTAKSTYNKASGERTNINPMNTALTVYSPTTTALGKSRLTSVFSSNKTDASVISKIQSMTKSSNKSYSEIAKQLGISTSTVSNYSRGKTEVDRLMSYDEDGNFEGYWSAIRMDD